MIGKIYGTGSYVPSFIMDNDALSRIVETNDAWIRERTGIVRRHIAKTETAASMAVEAAKRALEQSGIAPEEIDLILVSTCSSETILPCTACEVQREIGAVNACGFDLNSACTGFLYALNTAQAYMRSGFCHTALVIGAESMSNLVDWTDRGTCILFGDGAGAVILRAGEETGTEYYAVSHSDGSSAEALTCLSRHRKDWSRENEDPDSYMHMDGQGVFKFAVRKVPQVIKEVLEVSGLTAEEIDYFILHQANRRIVEAVARRMNTEIEKFPMNLDEYGNTSSASIPILLDEMNRDGRLKRGQKLVLSGFGAGLSWGAGIMEW